MGTGPLCLLGWLGYLGLSGPFGPFSLSGHEGHGGHGIGGHVRGGVTGLTGWFFRFPGCEAERCLPMDGPGN